MPIDCCRFCAKRRRWIRASSRPPARCTRTSIAACRARASRARLSAAIGLLTLALACLGIFGVVSYGVALRTKEIGIRVALGAQQPALLRAIVRQVLTPVVVGVGDWNRSRDSDRDGVAIGTVLPRKRRSDCVWRGARGVRGRRSGGGTVAGVPGAAQQSGRRVTAFVRRSAQGSGIRVRATSRPRPCRRPSSSGLSRRAAAVRGR